MIHDWHDAENACANYLEQAGFSRVRLTASGADGGIDIQGDDVIAQVKFWGQKVSRQHLQQLVGASHRSKGHTLVFFSGEGFSKPALQYGFETGMKLISFTSDKEFVCLDGSLPNLHLTSESSSTTLRISPTGNRWHPATATTNYTDSNGDTWHPWTPPAPESHDYAQGRQVQQPDDSDTATKFVRVVLLVIGMFLTYFFIWKPLLGI